MTLETTTLAIDGWTAARPRLRLIHETSDSIAGGVTSASSATAVGPTAAVNSFAASAASCTAASNSVGGSAVTGNDTSIVASVLVPADSPSPALTGTPAASGRSGSASRFSR